MALFHCAREALLPGRFMFFTSLNIYDYDMAF